MILIKRIEFLETEKSAIELLHMQPFASLPVHTEAGPSLASVGEAHEIVRGSHFIRPDGERVCIGVSKQAADIIGIQYEAWDRMDEEIKAQQQVIRDLRKIINYAEKAGLFTRIAWVFKGFL